MLLLESAATRLVKESESHVVIRLLLGLFLLLLLLGSGSRGSCGGGSSSSSEARGVSKDFLELFYRERAREF